MTDVSWCFFYILIQANQCLVLGKKFRYLEMGKLGINYNFSNLIH